MHTTSTQDETHSAAALHSRRTCQNILDAPVVSHVGPARTVNLCEVLYEVNRDIEIIEPDKKLVLIDRNEEYLAAFAQKMLAHFMPSYEACETAHQMPHYHVSESGLIKTYTNRQTAILSRMIARVKHPDSIFEKITRKQAHYGTLEKQNGSLIIDDIFGLTCLVQNPEQIEKLCEEIEDLEFLVIDKDQKDDRYHLPQNNGYKALHYNTRWNNGNSALENITVEIHVNDIQNHQDNICGSDSQPQRSHRFYAQDKLSKKHALEPYQVVIIDSSACIPAKHVLGRMKHPLSLEVARIETTFGSYILISTPSSSSQ